MVIGCLSITILWKDHGNFRLNKWQMIADGVADALGHGARAGKGGRFRLRFRTLSEQGRAGRRSCTVWIQTDPYDAVSLKAGLPRSVVEVAADRQLVVVGVRGELSPVQTMRAPIASTDKAMGLAASSP